MDSTFHHTEQEIVDQASARFRKLRSLHYYSRGKMRWDPAYRVIARQLKNSRNLIYDLGCGAGIFAAYLRECGIDAPVTGMDVDDKKIAIANILVAPFYSDLQFCYGDAADVKGEPGDLVALDILHYFAPPKQEQLLKTMAGMIAPGGRIFLRNGVSDSGWRHWATTAEEAFVRTSGWIRGGDWNFPSSEAVQRVLSESGLRVIAVPMWGNTPFSSHLFVGARPGDNL